MANETQTTTIVPFGEVRRAINTVRGDHDLARQEARALAVDTGSVVTDELISLIGGLLLIAAVHGVEQD